MCYISNFNIPPKSFFIFIHLLCFEFVINSHSLGTNLGSHGYYRFVSPRLSQRAAMASSDEQTSILEGELTCPICLDLFKDPHLLPCGHNFCLVCVRSLKRQCERGSFRCPECRESHRCSSEPLKNFKLANIADSLRSKAGTAARPPAPPQGAQAQFPAKTPASVPCDYCPAWGSEAAGGKGAEAAGGPEPGCEGGVEPTCSMAVKTCLKCEVSMCQEHVRPHLELPAFRSHLLTEPLADLRNRKCMEHDEMFR